MTVVDALILGLVEGLTELLPVSSTGHLILVGKLLGHEDEAAKSFEVVIQLGAILAVALYFRQRIGKTLVGMVRRDGDSLRLLGAIAAAFVPTAIVGLLLHKQVKALLFGAEPVAIGLIVGGVAMIAVERLKRQGPKRELEQITILDGFVIGLFQCLALWPGASRSMTTMVGALVRGADTRTAAEFSFLLALPTLGAATVFDFIKNGHLILAAEGGATVLAVGLVTSFVVTWLVVAVFLRYVGRVGLTPFGIYRVVIGVVVLLTLGSRVV